MWKTAGVVFLCVAMAATASAQTRLGPNDTVRVDWPNPVIATDKLDAPTGFLVKAVEPTSTGVTVRLWEISDASDRDFTIPIDDVPSGLFSVTVTPTNEAGAGPVSNVIGPFGRATTPKGLTVSGSVVAGVR